MCVYRTVRGNSGAQLRALTKLVALAGRAGAGPAPAPAGAGARGPGAGERGPERGRPGDGRLTRHSHTQTQTEHRPSTWTSDRRINMHTTPHTDSRIRRSTTHPRSHTPVVLLTLTLDSALEHGPPSKHTRDTPSACHRAHTGGLEQAWHLATWQDPCAPCGVREGRDP